MNPAQLVARRHGLTCYVAAVEEGAAVDGLPFAGRATIVAAYGGGSIALEARVDGLPSASAAYDYEIVEGDENVALEDDGPPSEPGAVRLVPALGAWNDALALERAARRCSASDASVGALFAHAVASELLSPAPTLYRAASAVAEAAPGVLPEEASGALAKEVHNVGFGTPLAFYSRYLAPRRLWAALAETSGEHARRMIDGALGDVERDVLAALREGGEALRLCVARYAWTGVLSPAGAARLARDVASLGLPVAPLCAEAAAEGAAATFERARRSLSSRAGVLGDDAAARLLRSSGALDARTGLPRAAEDAAGELVPRLLEVYRELEDGGGAAAGAGAAAPVATFAELCELLRRRWVVFLHVGFGAWDDELEELCRAARWTLRPGDRPSAAKKAPPSSAPAPLNLAVLLRLHLWTLPELAEALAEVVLRAATAAGEPSTAAARATLPKIVLVGNRHASDPHGLRFVDAIARPARAERRGWADDCRDLAAVDRFASSGLWRLARDALARSVEEQQEWFSARSPAAPPLPPEARWSGAVAARPSEIDALKRASPPGAAFELRSPAELAEWPRDAGRCRYVLVEEELLERGAGRAPMRALYDARASCRCLFVCLSPASTPETLAAKIRSWEG